MAARTRSAPLGRSKWPLEPARLRWGARNGRSNPLGSAGALETNLRLSPLCFAVAIDFADQVQAYPETLYWAGPRMPVALNTETTILVHGMHGYALVYIYIYIWRCISCCGAPYQSQIKCGSQHFSFNKYPYSCSSGKMDQEILSSVFLIKNK